MDLKITETTLLRPDWFFYWIWTWNTTWKVSKYGVFSGPFFPHSDWTDRYFVSLRVQSECGKIRTRKTPYLDKFHTVKGTWTTLLDFDWFYDVFGLDFKNIRTTRTWLRLFLLCIGLELIKSIHQVGIFYVIQSSFPTLDKVWCGVYVCVCVCVWNQTYC